MTTAETREATQSSVRLTRVVVFVSDDTEIDYALPAGVALIAAVEDLIPRINERLRHKGRAVLDAEQTYQLCGADSRPLDPQQSLDEAGVFDGDALWLLPTEATERFEPVTENVSTAIAREATRSSSGSIRRPRGGWPVRSAPGWSAGLS